MSPNDETDPIVVNEIVVSQGDRRLDALADGFVGVDERSFEQLLDFSVGFGSLVNFYDLNDNIQGDWEEFFSADVTITIGSMLALDLALARRRFDTLCRATEKTPRFDAKFALFKQTAQSILDIARSVNTWLAGLSAVGGGEAATLLRADVHASIEATLGEQLRTLESYDEGAALPHALREPIGLDFDGFAQVWALENVASNGSIYRGIGRSRRINAALLSLDPIIESFTVVVADLQARARAAFESTYATGDHRPQASLFIAFARLFATAQRNVNTLSRRYSNFYYDEVLCGQEAGPNPDSVYLSFALADDEDVVETTLRAGTQFAAGEDADGLPILYGLDRELTVTAATISSLRTLRETRGPLLLDRPVTAGGMARSAGAIVDIDATETATFPQRVLATKISTAAESAAGGDSDASSWATFGPDSTGTSEVAQTVTASLGFAVASKCLLLTGGTRNVTLNVGFVAGEPLRDTLRELRERTGLSDEQILCSVFERAFTTYLSIVDGWYEVRYKITGVTAPDPQRGSFSLRLDELDPTVPPIVPIDPDDETAGENDDRVTDDPQVNATNPAPQLPTLKLYLRQVPMAIPAGGDVEVYPLSLLSGLFVSSMDVAVSVNGLSPTAIESSDGEIDQAVPYPLLGGAPVVGSYLQIYQPELFVKKIASPTITLDWFGLPPYDEGFYGWYKNYVIDLEGDDVGPFYDNDSFKVAFTILNPGPWTLASTGHVNLFDSDGPKDKVKPRQPFELGVEGNVPSQPYDPATGAIQMKLTGPPAAFGTDLYAPNVLKAVLEMLPNCPPTKPEPGGSGDGQAELPPPLPARPSGDMVSSKPEACDDTPLTDGGKDVQYPNDPFVPLAQLLTIDYAAAAQVTPGGTAASLYHLFPFGGYESVTIVSTPDPPPAGRAYLVAGGSFSSPADPSASGSRMLQPESGGSSATIGSTGTERPSPATLLPQIDGAGNLYIGFERPMRRQTLSLLLQFVAAIDDAALPTVTWELLDAGNRWAAITTLADGTNGMANSGLLNLGVPQADAAGITLLPADTAWLRASVAAGPQLFPRSETIYAHGGTATRDLGDATGEDLRTPLPAGTITSPVDELPDIETVSQPLPSFGGRAPENRAAFELRLGERLRHKDRASVAWDYERLVLQRFPQVSRVAVLPAGARTGIDPGGVRVVVVPAHAGDEVVDPTVPRASSHELERIGTALAEIASPFAAINVVNPRYVRITVHSSVEFGTGEAEGELIDRLDADLVAYLSPWYFDAAREARGGGYASEEEISRFIQSRSYVAILDRLVLRYAADGLEGFGQLGALLAELQWGWYYLTSANGHEITTSKQFLEVTGANDE